MGNNELYNNNLTVRMEMSLDVAPLSTKVF